MSSTAIVPAPGATTPTTPPEAADLNQRTTAGAKVGQILEATTVTATTGAPLAATERSGLFAGIAAAAETIRQGSLVDVLPLFNSLAKDTISATLEGGRSVTINFLPDGGTKLAVDQFPLMVPQAINLQFDRNGNPLTQTSTGNPQTGDALLADQVLKGFTAAMQRLADLSAR